MKKFGTAIILAGGKSFRMGFDKQFLQISEKRLMEDIISHLETEFEDIVVVTNKLEEYQNFSYRITSDIYKDVGPLGGVHAGLSISNSKFAFVVACDMPKLNMNYIRYMKNTLDEDKLGIATRIGEYIEPFSAFYSIEMIEYIDRYIDSNQRSITKFLGQMDIDLIEEKKVKEYSPNLDIFLNLNTKEDLDNYIAYIDNKYK